MWVLFGWFLFPEELFKFKFKLSESSIIMPWFLPGKMRSFYKQSFLISTLTYQNADFFVACTTSSRKHRSLTAFCTTVFSILKITNTKKNNIQLSFLAA